MKKFTTIILLFFSVSCFAQQGFYSHLALGGNAVFTTVTGRNNNIPISASNLQITVTTDLDSITGIDTTGIVQGSLIFIMNVDIGGSSKLTILHNSSFSLAGNRVRTNNQKAIILQPGQLVIAQKISSGWRIFDMPSLPKTYIYNDGSAPDIGWGEKKFVGTATTTSGVATFNVTNDGTSGGAALFNNVRIVNVSARGNVSSAVSVPIASVKTLTSGKILTVNVVVGTTLAILGPTTLFAPNGTVVDVEIIGN